jgi:hypothetical protein
MSRLAVRQFDCVEFVMMHRLRERFWLRRCVGQDRQLNDRPRRAPESGRFPPALLGRSSPFVPKLETVVRRGFGQEVSGRCSFV